MSFLIKQNKTFLSKDQKKKIEEIFSNTTFPFYLSKSFKEINKDLFLSHIILKRPEDRKNNEYNSTHANFFVGLINSFCVKNKIKN